MSKLKMTILVAALVVAAGAVFFFSGPNQLIASSSNSSACPAMADTDKAASSCSKTAAACPGSAALAGSGCAKSCSKSSCAAKKAGSTASLAPIPDREGSRIVLTGRYVCGSCDLGVSESCQAAFRTSDGKSYLLVKNNLSNELKETARDKDVEIVTRVQKYNGVKYLEVDIVRAL